MQFDTSNHRRLVASLINARPDFAGEPVGLRAAVAGLPEQTRRGLRRLGELRQQRGAVVAWLREALPLVNEGIDTGKLSRSERGRWGRRLHAAHGRLGRLDRQVAELEGVITEAVG